MDDDFATALRRSLEQTRAGNPVEAARLVQEALSRRGHAGVPPVGKPPAPDEKVAPNGTTPRSRLSEVIAGLARPPAGLDFGVARQAPEPDVPEGAAFERRHHEGPHGARGYRLYRPSGRCGPIRGVVLMLHGCTQSPEDFAVGTAMNGQGEQHGLVIVYPEQSKAHNASLCWNWFRPGDQDRAAGEPALLAELTAAVASEYDVPSAGVFAAGLSAGGAMAAILAQAHPELISAAGIHSGLAPGSAHDVVSAFAAMRGEAAPGAEALRTPAIIFHGSKDATVAPVNAGRIAGPLHEIERRSGKAPGRRFDVLTGRNAAGHPIEVWRVDGAGHAWSGGDASGTYTDPAGPDASAEMVRFFMSLLPHP